MFGVAEGGNQGVIIALVVHQVPHVEHALHRVRLPCARRALDEQEGQRLRAGGHGGCPKMASSCLHNCKEVLKMLRGKPASMARARVELVYSTNQGTVVCP